MRKTLLLGAALAALFAAAAPASAQNVRVSNIATSNIGIGRTNFGTNNGFGNPTVGNAGSISAVGIRGNTNVDNYKSQNVDLTNTGTLVSGQGYTAGRADITTLTASANPTANFTQNGGGSTFNLTNSTAANAGLSGVAQTVLVGIPTGANTAYLGTNISAGAIAVGAGANSALSLR